jgi:hypothetical protein
MVANVMFFLVYRSPSSDAASIREVAELIRTVRRIQG